MGEGEGVGQAGHLVVTGGDIGGVAGLGRGVTGERCVMGHGVSSLVTSLSTFFRNFSFFQINSCNKDKTNQRIHLCTF